MSIRKKLAATKSRLLHELSKCLPDKAYLLYYYKRNMGGENLI